LKSFHKLAFRIEMTYMLLHTFWRSLRFGEFEETQNTASFVTKTKQNDLLHTKMKAQNVIKTFPKQSVTIHMRYNSVH